RPQRRLRLAQEHRRLATPGGRRRHDRRGACAARHWRCGVRAIRNHQRAILAEKHVRTVSDERTETEAKSYGAVCMKLPVLVHQAGLAPALHHVAQLSKREKREILDHLAAQLRECGLLQDGTKDGLLRHAREANTPELWAA